MKRTRTIYDYRTHKMKQALKKNILLAACLLGNGDIFKEI